MMYSNCALNISVIIGSMMTASTKALQSISVTASKIIFIRHKLWTQGLDPQALDAWTPGLYKPRHLDSGRLDYASLDAWTLGFWTLGLRRTGRLNSVRLESGQLDVRALNDWALDAFTFGLWTPRQLDFGRSDAQRQTKF